MKAPERFALAVLPTPLVPARRLGAATPVLLKRDDLTGFAAAGHKARQLEYLVGAALEAGCDCLVTGGGPGSNFCAAAAAAAVVAGIDCELVYFGSPPDSTHPNLASALATGARVRFTGDPDRGRIDEAVQVVAAGMEASGRRAYPILRGGATPVGTIGMVSAVDELAGQLDAMGIEPAVIVVATGSGAACAGIALGAGALGRPWQVVGASVSRPLDEATSQVHALIRDCGAVLGSKGTGDDLVRLVDARGPGFGLASEEGEAAARLALREEGLVLDPVYTAKAFAVVLQLLQEGSTGPIVFWHTGGLLSAAHHLARAATVGAGT